MKRLLGLGTVIALLVAALAIAQWRKPHAEVSPDAVLHFVGDTEHELSRLPMTATRLSDADEIRIGNQLAERYKYMEYLREKTDESKQFRSYIEKVGAAVAGHAQRKLPYKFHYVPQDYMVNAFAIPGGHVYIGKGLLDLMDSEDELASVLGHEVEHIDRRHAVERLQTQASLQHLGLLRLLIELPINVFQAGYSKEQELEADREGTRLAVMSGYSATGAVRMFEAFDRTFREAKEQQAKSPQEEAPRVVLATLTEYFRSHPSSHQRIEEINSLIAREGWPVQAEKPFALAYLLWTNRAEMALSKHQYKQASLLATRALENNSECERALRAQADAESYQANFSKAADSYRKLLSLHPDNAGYIQYYAFLLASANRHSAATEFSRILHNGNNSYEALDSLAGLKLLNGNSDEADKIYSELKNNPDNDRTPDRLAWLGWWYYVAGNAPRACEMLESAVQQRPSNSVYLVNFAWTSIEQRRYEQAITTLNMALASATNQTAHNEQDNAVQSEISMARAVAHWLAMDRDNALAEFQSSLNREPAWKNPVWIGAQYSGTVSRAVAEMLAETERRKKAAEVNSRQAQ